MSEPMFPSGQAQPAPVAAPVAEPEKKSRKGLMLAGGALAGLALGAGAFYLLVGSGSSGEEASGAVAKGKPKATASAAANPQASTAAKPATTAQVATVTIAARDPFAPLFVTAVNSAPKPTTTTGSTTPTGTGSTATAATATKTSALVLTAVDPVKSTVSVTIDGKAYPNVAVGTPFGTYYQLYAVFNAKCAGFLVGDQSVPACIGKVATFTR